MLEKYSYIMKAFPYPFVLIVPHSDAIPPLDGLSIGDVVRVVTRLDEYVRGSERLIQDYWTLTSN